MNSVQELKLDSRTLFFAVSMLGFVVASMSASAARLSPKYRSALLAWSYSMAAMGCTYLLYFFRGAAPLFFTFLVPNMLATLVPACGILAFAHLLGKTSHAKLTTPFVVFGALGALAGYLDLVRFNISIVMISIPLVVLLWILSYLLGREAFSKRLFAGSIGALFIALTGLGFAYRAVISITSDPSVVEHASRSLPQVGSLIFVAIYVVASSMGFFAIVQDRQSQDLIEIGRRDSLTGLLNRRAFFEAAEALHAKGLRYSVIMIDIDHFKNVNDTYGHMGGDIILSHTARLISGAVRLSDLACRYGGEEFCIVLPDCGKEEASQLATRIVEQVRSSKVRLAGETSVSYTLSAGFSDRISDSGLPLSGVIDQADQALYRAKRGGRNQALPFDYVS